MSKSKDFALALRKYLEEQFIGAGIDAVRITPRSIPQALDAGLMKSGDEGAERAGAVILLRRATDTPTLRGGDNTRLLSVGLFDLVLLVTDEYLKTASATDGSEEDEVIALRVYELSDLIQTTIEAAPAVGNYSMEIIDVNDISDPASQAFGTVITIGARFIRG